MPASRRRRDTRHSCDDGPPSSGRAVAPRPPARRPGPGAQPPSWCTPPPRHGVALLRPRHISPRPPRPRRKAVLRHPVPRAQHLRGRPHSAALPQSTCRRPRRGSLRSGRDRWGGQGWGAQMSPSAAARPPARPSVTPSRRRPPRARPARPPRRPAEKMRSTHPCPPHQSRPNPGSEPSPHALRHRGHRAAGSCVGPPGPRFARGAATGQQHTLAEAGRWAERRATRPPARTRSRGPQLPTGLPGPSGPPRSGGTPSAATPHPLAAEPQSRRMPLRAVPGANTQGRASSGSQGNVRPAEEPKPTSQSARISGRQHLAARCPSLHPARRRGSSTGPRGHGRRPLARPPAHSPARRTSSDLPPPRAPPAALASRAEVANARRRRRRGRPWGGPRRRPAARRGSPRLTAARSERCSRCRMSHRGRSPPDI
jgi:hypothetical protein